MPAAPEFDFAAYARVLREQVENLLEGYTGSDANCPEHLAAAIRYSLLAPGKRLRPMLVLMSCEACGYERCAALPAAAAVEMIHTYSLIHDDLPAMDDDDMRRGRPSCHIKFGEATAILAGDALLALAFEVLSRDTHPAELAARCCSNLARAAGATNLVGGQEDDLRNEFAGGGVAELERIHRRKTGAMIRVSLRLGGMIGSASERELVALETYGEKLGLAFQIVDDLLDLSGDSKALGKKTKKDSGRGKLTFPSLLGADESRRRAAALVDEACSAIGGLADKHDERSQRGRQGLVALAKYVVERNS